MNKNEPVHPPLLVLTGATGVGKTGLSIDIARSFSGEIVSADSRQIYRGMDVGTGKADSQEQAAALHHLNKNARRCRTLFSNPGRYCQSPPARGVRARHLPPGSRSTPACRRVAMADARVMAPPYP